LLALITCIYIMLTDLKFKFKTALLRSEIVWILIDSKTETSLRCPLEVQYLEK